MKIEHDQGSSTPERVAPSRTLGCAQCGHTFTVHDGLRARAQKQRLQAGLPAEPDDTHKAFLSKAQDLAKVMR